MSRPLIAFPAEQWTMKFPYQLTLGAHDYREALEWCALNTCEAFTTRIAADKILYFCFTNPRDAVLFQLRFGIS